MKLKKVLKRAVIGILGLAGLAGGITFGPPAYVKSQDYFNKTKTEQKLVDLENRLSNDYGIPIGVWKEPRPLEFGDRPTQREQYSLRSFSPYVSLKALEGLEEVLRCYPPELINKAFHEIEIVKSFVKPWYNDTWEKQDITPLAKISFSGRISISAGRDDITIYHQALSGKIFNKDNLHHEIGHEMTRGLPIEEWKSLNPGAKYFPDTWKQLPEVPAGFYNKYATSSVDEDIASTIELLYSDKNNFERRTNQDPILKSKTELLKAWYHKKTDGKFDQEYWNKVQSGEAPY